MCDIIKSEINYHRIINITWRFLKILFPDDNIFIKIHFVLFNMSYLEF